MKRLVFTPLFCVKALLCCSLAGGMGLLMVPAAYAQDSAFLACARHEDRGQRIACLEDALEAVTAAQSRSAPAAISTAPAASPPEASSAAPPAAVPAAAPPASASPPQPAVADDNTGSDPSLLDRLRGFGQRNTSARIEADTQGNEVLHDSITKLERRNDLWLVTLSSGQVWRQEYPRTLNLRVGDEIIIEQGVGIGSGYRLATPRLSGFIRVVRVQ